MRWISTSACVFFGAPLGIGVLFCVGAFLYLEQFQIMSVISAPSELLCRCVDMWAYIYLQHLIRKVGRFIHFMLGS